MTVSRSPEAGRTPERVPEVWGKVPPPNRNFTGRDELLRRLRSGIATDVTAVVPHALHGLGGVGKTQIAIEYAWRYRSEYDVVWWIPADQPLLVRASLAALAPFLGLPIPTATGIEDAAGAVLDSLRRGEPYARWLLVFDNADQPEELGDVYPRGPGHVLITSRNPRWHGVVDTVAVDVFDREESLAFLHKRVSKTIDAADADRLAAELGDLPLALEQAGALLARTNMSVEEYLRLLQERTGHLLAEGKPSEYPLSMTAAWALSVSRLADTLPEALEVLRCCAFLGPEPIPRDIFRPGERAKILGLAAILAKPVLLSQAITELGRFALARIDKDNRTIQVHRLVQALLREELSAEERDRFQHVVHLLLADAAPNEPDKTINWPKYGDLTAHIAPAGVAECPEPEVRRLALNVVRYLLRSGNYQSARSFLDLFLREWTKASGAHHHDVLVAHRHLGHVVREMGRFREAYEIDSATLERMTRILGREHQETLVLTNGLGADLRARGDFRAARELDEDLLRRHEVVFGPSGDDTLRAMNNLALDHALNNDYRSARELHERTYTLQVSAGASRLDVLGSYSGLARAVRLCGDYAQARDLGEDAHAYGVQTLGAEHPWTLRTAKDLSIALRQAGEFTEALDLAQDVYTRVRRVLGDAHPDTVAAAINLSHALQAVGDLSAAFPLAADAVDRYGQIYGDDHPYTRGCSINVALLLRRRGKVAEARGMDEATLEGLDARLGRDHHYSLICAVNLASDLAELGEVQTARRLGEDTLSRLRALLGEDYPLTLACAGNLVLDLRADGEDEAADRLFAEVRTRYERTISLDHPEAGIVLLGRRIGCDFDPSPL